MNGTTAVMLTYRAFGCEQRDLDIDFVGVPPPQTVTQILLACALPGEGAQLDESFFWSLDVGERIAGLLQVVASGQGDDLSVPFKCREAACGQSFEVDLDIASMLVAHGEAAGTDLPAISLEGTSVSIRRPTGRDQQIWSRRVYPNAEAARQDVMTTLIDDPPAGAAPPLDVIDPVQVEQMLQRGDPLVSPSLDLTCPVCGLEAGYTVDLQAVCLGRLRRMQQHLFETIHRLASRYHWTESDIFSLSPGRRAHYLALIEREFGL